MRPARNGILILARSKRPEHSCATLSPSSRLQHVASQPSEMHRVELSSAVVCSGQPWGPSQSPHVDACPVGTENIPLSSLGWDLGVGMW